MLEINVGGVYVPAALVWAVGAFVLSTIIDRVLSRTTFYRMVWHRALFELGIFVILWGAVSGLTYQFAFSAVAAK